MSKLFVGPEEGPGAEITGGCESPSIVLGIELRAFKRTTSSLNHWAIFPPLNITFTLYIVALFFSFFIYKEYTLLRSFYSLSSLTSLHLCFVFVVFFFLVGNATIFIFDNIHIYNRKFPDFKWGCWCILCWKINLSSWKKKYFTGQKLNFNWYGQLQITE